MNKNNKSVSTKRQRILKIFIIAGLLVCAFAVSMFLKKSNYDESAEQIGFLRETLKELHLARSECQQDLTQITEEERQVCLCHKQKNINMAVDKIMTLLQSYPALDLEDYPVFDPIVNQDIIYSEDLLPTLRQELGFCPNSTSDN